MAITGSAFALITPAQRHAGFPTLESRGEATSQTYTMGTPVLINASGVIQEQANGGTTLWGFTAKAGLNKATDGAVNVPVYKITPDALFQGTLSVASWDKSLIGSKASLSKISSTYCLVTAANGSQCVIRGLADGGRNFSTGDQTPEVIFSIVNTMIQGEF